MLRLRATLMCLRQATGAGGSAGLGAWSTRAFTLAYPWLHTCMEAATLAYHVAFLMGASPVHHPVLHALGLKLTRTSGQDLVRRGSEPESYRMHMPSRPDACMV